MKAVALVSGGMDSAALLYYLRANGFDELLAVSFDYGQRHKRELEYADALAQNMGFDHYVIDLSNLSMIFGGSALTDPGIEVPEGHYADETMRATVVPNRNAMMITFAFSIAVHEYATAVGVGVHAGDHPIYPDCRPEFIESINDALRLGTYGHRNHDLRILAPFLHSKKSDIVTIGESLGVPWGETWSCYKGGRVHCGRCGTCVERREAFEIAQVTDPTIYADSLHENSFE